MLSMTEIKIKEEVRGLEQEIQELERAVVEEEALRREKIAGCNSAREMYEAQVRCIQAELEELGKQIQGRQDRREKLQVKHDTIFASLGRVEDEQGEKIPSHAYYLVKLAQEKAELKDASAVLKKKIKKEEGDLRSLQKALGMIKNSNSDFRTGNLRRKAAEDAELAEVAAEVSARRVEVAEVRRSLEAAEREAAALEQHLLLRDSQLEQIKCECEERQESLRLAARAVKEQVMICLLLLSLHIFCSCSLFFFLLLLVQSSRYQPVRLVAPGEAPWAAVNETNMRHFCFVL